MGLRKGFAAAREVKEQMDSDRAAWGDRMPLFSLRDGESAELRFNGFPEDEPVILDEHSVKNGPRPQDFDTIICNKCFKKKCVGCYKNTNGDRRVGRPQPKGHMNLVDLRFVHKVKNKEKSERYKKDIYDYVPCSDDARCKRCKKQRPREIAGQKRSKWSMTWVNALQGVNEAMKKRCLSCKTGKIKVIAFECANCNKPIDYDPEDGNEKVKCRKCKQRMVPTPVVECNKCDDPVPASIFDVNMLVSREGSGTSTSYTFQPQYETLGLTEVEVGNEIIDLDSFEPKELDKVLRPMSTQKQAERLRCEDPYGSGGGDGDGDDAPSDDDEDDVFDEDDEAEDFDDDEDEE